MSQNKYKSRLVNLITTPERVPVVIDILKQWDEWAEISTTLLTVGPHAGNYVTHAHSDNDTSLQIEEDGEYIEVYELLIHHLLPDAFDSHQITIMWGNGEMNGWSFYFNSKGLVTSNSLDREKGNSNV